MASLKWEAICVYAYFSGKIFSQLQRSLLKKKNLNNLPNLKSLSFSQRFKKQENPFSK